MEGLLSAEVTVVTLLLIVTIIALIAKRTRMPYTVLLVLVGFLLSFQTYITLELTADVILFLFLPPLIFEAALAIQPRLLRSVLLPVTLLAIPGVLVVAVIVAGALTISGMLPFKYALLFGALIAATDPVAVISLFKTLGAPKRLATLVESESLFNDATTIVFFGMIFNVLFLGHTFTPAEAVIEFSRVALGGALIGVVIGHLGDLAFSYIDDTLIETTLSAVVAYGSYLFAEQLHMSGVLAVVFAGIFIGSGSERSMSPTTRTMLHNFWGYIAFIANSIIFILIGAEINVSGLAQAVVAILLAVIAVLVARMITVYGFSGLSKLLRSPVPIKHQHILFWGGLRGAVSLALALSLARALPNRDMLLHMTYGVVLFTLLVQGTTISRLMKRLGLTGRPEVELQYEALQGRLLATHAAYQRMEERYRNGSLDPQAWRIIAPELKARIEALEEEIAQLVEDNPDILERIVHSTRLEVLRTERAAVLSLQREGILSEVVAEELMREIDEMLENPPLPDSETVKTAATSNAAAA